MANYHSVSGAGKSTVSDESNRVTQPGADYRGSRRQHFSHSGSAFRSFVANDDNVSRFDFAGQNRFQAKLLRIKNARRPGNALLLDTTDFRDRALGREVA